MDRQKPEDLLEFPCHYQFKAVGRAGDVFYRGIVDAVGKYADVSRDSIRCRPSGKGTYQAVSILVTLHNYQQLTDIYAEMKKTPGLKMLL
jgi:putative lipoic acid-binding regulatory protein